MNPRFPSVESVRDSLGDSANMANYHARSAGAFQGIYAIAITEFEILRGLATAAMSGDPVHTEALRIYLRVQEATAELYVKEQKCKEARIPKIRH